MCQQQGRRQTHTHKTANIYERNAKYGKIITKTKQNTLYRHREDTNNKNLTTHNRQTTTCEYTINQKKYILFQL